MDKTKIKTCGSVIKEARLAKEMTISDLNMAINHKKVDEKLIKQWENSKAYPDLDMCYKLAYILGVNPTELLGLRNFERKKFKAKGSKKRTFWNSDVPDEFIWTMKGILGLILILIAFYVVVMFKKLENSVIYGGKEELEEIVVETIEKNTNGIDN